MKLKLDLLTRKDIPALQSLAEEIGWGYSTDNWKQFFSLGVVCGHRGLTSGLFSCAVMIKYDQSFRWLTSFVVSPNYQRRGLARELWSGLLANDIAEEPSIGLVSTDEGIKFYESIDFKQVTSVHKYVRPNGFGLKAKKYGDHLIRPFIESDVEFVVSLDEGARGTQRRSMLLGKLRASTGTLVSCDKSSRPNGFVIAVMEGNLLCLGPVVAPDENTAADLIIEVATNFSSALRLDILAGKNHLLAILEENQFMMERVAPVLSYGGRPLPQTLPSYIALAAQALG